MEYLPRLINAVESQYTADELQLINDAYNDGGQSVTTWAPADMDESWIDVADESEFSQYIANTLAQLEQAYEQAVEWLSQRSKQQTKFDTIEFELDFIREVLRHNSIKFTETIAWSNSHYFDCKFNDTYFKIRYADHSQCYDADINIAVSNSENLDGIGITDLQEELTKYINGDNNN